MAVYYVNKNTQLNGEHEIHKMLCPYFPIEINRQLLGSFSDCEQALDAAGEFYSLVNGCYWCCRDCHSNENLPNKANDSLQSSN